MKSTLSAIFFSAAICFTFSVVLFAHHGTIAYDLKHPVTLQGTVTEFVWSNPHVQIYFDVKNENGSIEHWACETNSPGRLIRDGWSKNLLKPGDPITVTLFQSKKGAPVGLLRDLKLANGRVFEGQQRTKEETQ